MPYIEVDIYLDEFEITDLVNEVTHRIKKTLGKEKLTSAQKDELKQSALDILEAFKLTPTKQLEIKTLDDKIKYEHFCKVFNKYSVSDIESKLP